MLFSAQLCSYSRILTGGTNMKQIIFIIIICAASFAVVAQDTPPKTFNEMSYEELKAVDQAPLDKKAKKSLKKALIKAKKAERAAIQAKKKRLKREAKAEKKRRAAATKKLKKITKYYRATSINKDEFTTNYEIKGPNITERMDWNNLFFSMQKIPIYALAAEIEPGDMGTTLVLGVAVRKEVAGINSFRLEILGKSIAQYADENNIWPQYNAALLKGGKKRGVESVSKKIGECTFENCVFMEIFAIELQLDDIEEMVQTRSELAVRVSAENASNLIIRIPFSYLTGFLWKFSEMDSQFNHYLPLVEEAKQFVLSR